MICSAQPKLDLDSQQLNAVALVEDELVACLSSHNKKSAQSYLTPQDFVELTYVTNSTVPEKDREYELFFQPAGVLPKKVIQVGFNEAIIELVKANLGVSILSKRQLTKYALMFEQEDIQTIPLGENGLKIYWHLVSNQHDAITKPAVTFCELFKAQN